eukprot:3995635-Pyramimonas_sp.AAC.1
MPQSGSQERERSYKKDSKPEALRSDPKPQRFQQQGQYRHRQAWQAEHDDERDHYDDGDHHQLDHFYDDQPPEEEIYLGEEEEATLEEIDEMDPEAAESFAAIVQNTQRFQQARGGGRGKGGRGRSKCGGRGDGSSSLEDGARGGSAPG